MSAVLVNTYTQSVTYVADNMLRSLKNIILLSGLDPAKLVGDWKVLLDGISTWLNTQHLESVTLEIYDPATDALVGRWDMTVQYRWDAVGDGNFWTDTDQIKFAIKKQGLLPSQAAYRVIVTNKSGKPAVTGWNECTFRSTDGMVRQSLGTTVDHNGLGAQAAYWRKTNADH